MRLNLLYFADLSVSPKLPGAIAWAKKISDSTPIRPWLIDGEEPQGPAKLAVAAYHRDVVAVLYEALGGVAITGGDRVQ